MRNYGAKIQFLTTASVKPTGIQFHILADYFTVGCSVFINALLYLKYCKQRTAKQLFMSGNQ